MKIKTRKKQVYKPVIPLFPVTTPGYYTIYNIMAITGWSRQTVYNRMNAGLFPKPIKLPNTKSIRWKTSIVKEALGL